MMKMVLPLVLVLLRPEQDWAGKLAMCTEPNGVFFSLR